MTRMKVKYQVAEFRKNGSGDHDRVVFGSLQKAFVTVKQDEGSAQTFMTRMGEALNQAHRNQWGGSKFEFIIKYIKVVGEETGDEGIPFAFDDNRHVHHVNRTLSNGGGVRSHAIIRPNKYIGPIAVQMFAVYTYTTKVEGDQGLEAGTSGTSKIVIDYKYKSMKGNDEAVIAEVKRVHERCFPAHTHVEILVTATELFDVDGNPLAPVFTG